MPNQREIRVLFVINSLAGGGAERVFSTLVRELHAHDDSLAITVALLDEIAAEAYAISPGIPVRRLDARGGMLRSILSLRGLARGMKPDVTVAFLSRANVAAVIAARSAGTPAIISERVNTTAHLESGRMAFLSRWLIRTFYPQARQVIAVSGGVADTLEKDFGVARNRIRVVHNPVDMARIRDLATLEPAIDVTSDDFVTMGRLVPNKNTAMAIRALAASSAVGRLIVLGEGPLQEELETLAASLGLSERVVFAGFHDNPYSILARAGCYLLTSYAEGFPNAMVEAMATGLPVIATDCPSGPAEILEVDLKGSATAFNRGGALVAMNDHAAMATVMDKFAQPATRRDVSAEAVATAQTFSVERAVGSVREAILEAAGGAQR